MKTLIYLLLIVSTVLARTLYKDLSGTQMRKFKGWVFLDRMVLDSGYIDISLNVELKSNYNQPNDDFQLELLLVSDSIWQLLNEN